MSYENLTFIPAKALWGHYNSLRILWSEYIKSQSMDHQSNDLSKSEG